MRFWSLGSGSGGNAFLLEDGAHRVLVDCGFGPRTLSQRLAAIGVAPESIGTLVLTHEHVDHAKGATQAQTRWGWRVVGSTGTLAGVRELDRKKATALAPDGFVAMDGFDLRLIPVPHDAAAPTACVITARGPGWRVGIAHDLGHVPDGMTRHFRELDALVIEANHDVERLRSGPYPAYLKDRITGGRGHLNNSEAAGFAAEVAHPGLRTVMLAHLSAENNTPTLALGAVRHQLTRARWSGRLVAAVQDAPVAGVEAANQFELTF
ncbi:MAG: MBL fold metallo-hydrolase [Gemmatimonadaceae bacterium]|nr:MBL fold metallo-hydrolase [Gemmatimonadaceae bacterium]